MDHSASRREMAQQAVDAALSRAPYREEPRLAAAFVAYYCFRDYEAALRELAIAQRGLPNDPTVFSLPAFIARRKGNWEECIYNFERAVELDPRNVWTVHQAAQTYWFLRRFSDMARLLDRAVAVGVDDANTRVARSVIELEERADTNPAQEAIEKALAADPSAVDAIAEQWFYVALCRREAAAVTSALASIPEAGIVPFTVRMPRPFCAGLAGQAKADASAANMAFREARREMENVLREQPDYAEGLSILGMIDAALGGKEDALRESHKAVELMPINKDAITGAEVRRNLAITYAWSGEKTAALDVLEQAVQQSGPISYGQLRLHPWWDPLRDDPRFEKIMEQAKEPVALA